MTNVLAILILTTGFSVAVETKDGFVERSFVNTPEGVEQFLDFSDPLIAREGKTVKVCTVTLAEDGGAVMHWLLANNIGPAMMSSVAHRSYAEKNAVAQESAVTAAHACLATFPFMRKAQ